MTAELWESLPPPPCHACQGTCCVRVGFPTLVELTVDEAPQFPEALQVDNGLGLVWALPTTEAGRCIHLAVDNRCRIYARRPLGCRQFNCRAGYRGPGARHSFFLEDHPEVVELLEREDPHFDKGLLHAD